MPTDPPIPPCPDAPTPTPYEAVPSVHLEGSEPLESVCRLYVARTKNFRGTSNVSTAFLIENNCLVTAGHNVHSQVVLGFGSRVRYGTITAGHTADGNAWEAGARFTQQDISVAKDYRFWPKRYDRDYAVIRLGTPAPRRSSFRLLRPDDDPLTMCESVFIAGHPGKPWDTNQMHTAQGYLTDLPGAGEAFVSYSIDTHTGNSGGPVWVERKGERIVIGVHIFEGTARYIDQEVRDDIERWQAQ